MSVTLFMAISFPGGIEQLIQLRPRSFQQTLDYEALERRRWISTPSTITKSTPETI